jgi:GTPase
MALLQESDDGNTEYKRHLHAIKGIKLEKLMSQMQFRMREGNGVCIYYLGVNDDGTPYNMTNVERIQTIENILFVITQLNFKLEKFEKNDTYYKITINDTNLGTSSFFI